MSKPDNKVDLRYQACLEKALKRMSVLQVTYEETSWLREARSLADILVKLKDKDDKVRQTAIYFLGGLGDKRAASALIHSMRTDPDIDLRGSAADALGFIGDKRAVTALLDTLQNDPCVKVRERAASGLRVTWRDKRVVDVLVAVMANKGEYPYVREMVAEALYGHDPKKAAPVLIESLSDESVNVRYWSAASLTEMKCAEALPELARLAATDTAICYDPDGGTSCVYGSVSGAAARALLKIKQDLGMPLTTEEAEYLARCRSEF
ncbi:MAG TPA: HEAT repeat domain-containing protein [Capsulimonadaceae bacterium]|nr:HEAT repeat domain-containing protein [Capsulimonadaceae bacterium]